MAKTTTTPTYISDAIKRWQEKGLALPAPPADVSTAIQEGMLQYRQPQFFQGEMIGAGGPTMFQQGVEAPAQAPTQPQAPTAPAGAGIPRFDMAPDLAEKATSAITQGMPVSFMTPDGKIVPWDKAPSGAYHAGYMQGPEGLIFLPGEAQPKPELQPWYLPEGGVAQVTEEGRQAMAFPAGDPGEIMKKRRAAAEHGLKTMKPLEIMAKVEHRMGMQGTAPNVRVMYRQMLLPFLIARGLDEAAAVSYMEEGFRSPQLSRYIAAATEREAMKERAEISAARPEAAPIPLAPKKTELDEEREKKKQIYQKKNEVKGIFWVTPSGGVIPITINTGLGSKMKVLLDMSQYMTSVGAGEKPPAPYVVEYLGGARRYQPPQAPAKAEPTTAPPAPVEPASTVITGGISEALR